MNIETMRGIWNSPWHFQYILTPVEERGPDPFDVVFPKMTKCTLNTYGPSGTVQNHDALCVMTVNVLNEKARERERCSFESRASLN